MKTFLFLLLTTASLCAVFAFPKVAGSEEKVIPPPKVWSSQEIKARVLLEFGADFLPIIACESNFRQFDSTGGVLTSRTNDAGTFQINRKTWQKTAEGMGLDIDTVDGNFAVAHLVLRQQGKTAWVCYNKQHE